METIDLKNISSATPVVLQCVDGSEVRIVRARRVHHSRSKTQPWENTEVFYVTANDEELELDDVSDILNFGYLRNEVADKLFVVLDNPDQMWPITASQILKLVAASPIEEAMEKPEVKEEVAEAVETRKKGNHAAELLWGVVANVSEGDWSKQPKEWQEAAARARDNYFASLRLCLAESEAVSQREEIEAAA